MDPLTHVIDPNGEVIIVLLNAGSSFAEMSEDKNKKKGCQFVLDPLEPLSPPIAEPAISEDPTPTDEPILSAEPVPTGDTPAERAVQQPVETGIVPESLDGNSFRIQVSAKHLMFASSFFRKLLTGLWKENVTNLERSPVEITAEDWDIEALLILLRAIHGQQYQILRKLTLEMLAKVAVLADYYDCKEAVYIWTTTWIDAQEEEVPKTCSRDSFLWLWISWFFQLPARFEETTSTIMSWSDGWIDNLGLPIPDRVIGAMNKRREEVIDNLICRIHQTQKDFLNGSRGCIYECRSIMYGALTKEMQSNDLLSPLPTSPFPGKNYQQLAQKVSKFKSPQWTAWTSRSSAFDSPYRHNCLNSTFATIFSGLNGTIEGLHLYSFIS
ncbi:hypothetical protein PISL3812_09797 [Talaromyces islandicus]|uniref:Uncharacterized protein n=1 Tax=Talaromyces islandicus TaxID=28573 RepID=A0A0U1MCA1_TALIS|nr:hypothetical protein PISL3812_09797 [Talaromyces islandicus]